MSEGGVDQECNSFQSKVLGNCDIQEYRLSIRMTYNTVAYCTVYTMQGWQSLFILNSSWSEPCHIHFFIGVGTKLSDLYLHRVEPDTLGGIHSRVQ